ncbi:MAG: EAL domain-containing protein [Gammaproteobacteria bacterium]|nr:EAL domain-containing protein [Gammaproteobacteria bacterium]
MAQLANVPFTELKIDRAFVHGAARDTAARAILESSIALGKKLDMVVVAEGVEDRADWDLGRPGGLRSRAGLFHRAPHVRN